MSPILIVGIIVSVGFLFGEIAKKLKLPKVTGYILAGVLLNPTLFDFIPKSFVAHTDVITNIALCFITFSVGGTLLLKTIKKTGKSLLSITFFEAEATFFAITVGFICIMPFFFKGQASMPWTITIIPLALLLGSIGAPTDPSATLAVQHQYKAKGEVSNAMMEVAAFDDALGIINFSVAMVIAKVLVDGQQFSVYNSVCQPIIIIFGAIITGVFFGFAFNAVTKFIKRETEGALIVVIMASLLLCYGIANYFKFDELFAIMTFGAIVVNFHPKSELIFQMLQRYTDEMVFVVFFTLSGMFLNLKELPHCILYIVVFVVLRVCGKIVGTRIGANLGGASVKVKKFTAGGLIPQGGIVVGLALKATQIPSFNHLAGVVINVIIGATIIFEIIGPIIAKQFLKRAGEIES